MSTASGRPGGREPGMRQHDRRLHQPTAPMPTAPTLPMPASYPLAPPLPASPAPFPTLPPSTPPLPPSALTPAAASEALSLCRHNRYDDLVQMMDASDASSGDWSSIADAHGNTMLLVAAQNGLKRICKLLLRRGAADVRVVNTQGKGVLHFCQLYGHAQLGEYLRGKGAAE